MRRRRSGGMDERGGSTRRPAPHRPGPRPGLHRGGRPARPAGAAGPPRAGRGRGGRRLLSAAAAPGPPRHPQGRAGAPLGHRRAGRGRAAGRVAGHPERRLARHLQRRAKDPGAVAGRRAPPPGRAAGLGRDHRSPAGPGRRGADQGGRGAGGRGEEGLDPPADGPAGGRRAPWGARPPLPGRHRPGVAAPRVISSISSKSSSPAESGPMGTPMELNRVLIVDDDPAIRRVVSALLDLDEYGLLEAADGQAALEVVKVERPDLVILDLTMPRLDGLRACQALRSDPELAGTRVLVLTGRDQPDDRAAARDAGADAYLVKPFSSLALLDAVKRLTDGCAVDPGTSHLEQLEVAERQLLVFAREINHLYQAERARAAELERALDRLRGSYLDMIKTLAFVVEAKDPSTRAHLQRTHDYAVALAEAVDPELAADEQLRYGFLLHDVGKVGIPEAVLNKPGPLDPDEWEIMRAHPLLGVQMVAGIKSLGSAVEVIRCHHERWDGKGYPNGLAGEAIPAGARGFSVADAFDAMTSDRAYRKALSFDQACQEIADGAGSQFDPMVVDAFTAILPELPGLHAALHAGPVDSLTHSIP